MSAGYTRAGYIKCDAGLNARRAERARGRVQQIAGYVASAALMTASVAMVVATAALKRHVRGRS